MSAEKDRLWTTLDVLSWTGNFFQEKGIEKGRFEAERLLAHVLNCQRLDLYLNYDKPLSKSELRNFRELVAARGKREPLQYLIGSQEFWSIDLEVGPEVLVPRPDSERLVEIVIERAGSDTQGRILDLGTGSGAIAIALSTELHKYQVFASDLGFGALKIASRNAGKSGTEIFFARGDWLEMFKPGSFDIVVSNPPYIRSRDFDNLMPEVKLYEPRLALDGGADGLDCYRVIIADTPRYLKPGGVLVLEIGFDQADDIGNLFHQAQVWKEWVIYQDYAGHDRVAAAEIGKGEKDGVQ